MGAIYLRHGEDWVPMTEQPYEAEAVLQVLLAEHPEILAGNEPGGESPGWILVRREAGIADAEDAGDRWSLDHLFLDRKGVPTLVEAKRSSDPRARREVVAQMLDYAANSTSFWTVDRLQAWFEGECERGGIEPAAALEDAFGVSEPESYWLQVQTNLAADRIRLVFVADQIAPELSSIVEYLNRQMRETEVLAVEVRQYVDGAGTRQTLVPRVIGRTAAAMAAKGAAARSGQAFDPASAPEAFRVLVERMDEVAQDLDLLVRTAPTGRTYLPKTRPGGAAFYTGIGVYGTSRGAEFNLEVFRELGRDDLADDLLQRLRNLTGQQIRARAWPAVPCEALVQSWSRARQDVIDRYFAAREELVRGDSRPVYQASASSPGEGGLDEA